ncbi:uncharacterized protein B0H64DRAFT_444617 [Chaetomium fimeti]|uniref:C2H2-type domain-containing protein n=1 Tax=Chaetomium fimeti TaxID=1854472 RepID=A0AAE0LQ58_9PEZI|nr:hypothetical protein B0H64DRAFT_444617 [Chaetomium fimeti]
MNASNGDLFHGSGSADDVNHYQLAPKSFSGVTYDRFYAPPPSGSADTTGVPGYSYQSTAPGRMDNSNFLLPEHPAGAPRSQPPSATSSIAPDSPATPAGGELDGDRSGGTVHPPVPKLERTTTDAYADELYNENFAAMSQSSAQTSISPTSDLFSQRLQAANNQRFSAATNSPVSSISRDRSPFRTGSPMAAIPVSDYRSAMGLHTRFGTAQQSRDQSRAMHNAQAVRQQIGMATPQTISPKDAMLEYRDTEGDNNFPLFPQRNTTGFDANAINKAAAAHSQQLFGSMSMDPVNDYLITSVPTPQFPFTNQPQSTMHSTGNPSRATTVDTGASEHGVAPQRPADTRADGGTYTCTYHGCTQRFKTPAILQKHKREGHRQAHGLSGSGTALGLVDTQAGPHKCDRINPSTGKPCNTVFSRPYDLTRHEHTIHNAEKQKVRCHICSDEKTFSRADALTRHYRVTHGDVEIPGKHRKRGGQA